MTTSDLLTRRFRLALPFTTLTGAGTVRLIAGEDFRYSLKGAGIEAWLPHLLTLLDGQQTLEMALRDFSRERREAALEVVEQLYGERALVDGTAVEAHRAANYRLVIEGSGKLRERLETNISGGKKTAEPIDAQPLLVFCQDTLDYAAALDFNRRCRLHSSPWLWATCGPMARGYVGPLFWRDAGPCLGCLLRHFQRLSPAPELYDELIKASEQRRAISPTPFPDPALAMLESLVRWKLSAAGEAEPPAALYRLHVVEAATMEVSTHRVFNDPECPECRKAP